MLSSCPYTVSLPIDTSEPISSLLSAIPPLQDVITTSTPTTLPTKLNFPMGFEHFKPLIGGPALLQRGNSTGSLLDLALQPVVLPMHAMLQKTDSVLSLIGKQSLEQFSIATSSPTEKPKIPPLGRSRSAFKLVPQRSLTDLLGPPIKKEKMILKDLETVDKSLKTKDPDETPPASNESAPVPPLHVQIPVTRPLPTGPAASPYGSPLGPNLLPPPASTTIPHPLPVQFPLNGDLQTQLHLDYANPVAVAAAVAAASRQLTPTTQHELPSQGTAPGNSGLLLPGNELHPLKPPMGEINAFGHATQLADWQQQLMNQGYQSSPSPGSSRMGGNGSMGCEDESTRKRQEYVKCLENRVAVLENQNKALIEELKTLKELYCRKEKGGEGL